MKTQTKPTVYCYDSANEHTPILDTLIFGLPLFDETETEKPSLERIAKELNIEEPFEVMQEDLALSIRDKIIRSANSHDALIEASNSVLDLSYRDECDHDEVKIPLNVLEKIENALKQAESEV